MFKYRITKLFVSGPLKGLKIKEDTNVFFNVGDLITAIAGGSSYLVTGRIVYRNAH